VSEEWKPLIDGAVVSPGSIVAVEVDGDEAVTWRTRSGPPCVMARRCPHLDWDLTEAVVVGDELVCHGHGWSLRSDGHAFKRNERGREDAKGTIRTWPAREREGWIEVDAAPERPTTDRTTGSA
jgi:nitrite reductase/ring-hydroxylating ferredoxin subunit